MVRYDSLYSRLSVLLLLASFTAVLFFGCGGGSGGGISSQQQTPRDVLSSVSKAASIGDNATVLSYFVEPAQEAIRAPLSNTENLIALGNAFGKAVEYKVTARKAIFISNYTDNGVQYSFYINMVKDDDGSWKIKGF